MIPDLQTRPGVPLDHMLWAGRYALEKRPDVIIQLGDAWDMNSLNRFDSAAMKAVKGADVKEDIEVGNEAFRLFSQPIYEYNKKSSLTRRYSPRLIRLMGNHEARIARAHEEAPWLRAAFSEDDLESPGWEVVPFLKPICVDGVWYCHYFCRNASGQVTQTRNGHPNARVMVQREGKSCTAGHLQGLDIHLQPRGNTIHRGLIAGSFYQHDEEYLSPQGNNHWRGIILKHEVKDGNYNLCEVSLGYLKREYS